MNTFIIAFPASSGGLAFFVHPSEFGAPACAREPWMRAEHLATQFPTQEAAREALALLMEATRYVAPECNRALGRRLDQARIIPAAEVPAGVRLARVKSPCNPGDAVV
jgi:hypothetical protein